MSASLDTSREITVHVNANMHYARLIGLTEKVASDYTESLPRSESTLFEETPESNAFRASLLGRPFDQPTSFRDLLFGRLFFDLPNVPYVVGLLTSLYCIHFEKTDILVDSINAETDLDKNVNDVKKNMSRTQIRKLTARSLHQAVGVISRDIIPEWEGDPSDKKKDLRTSLLQEFVSSNNPNASLLHQMFGISRDARRFRESGLSHELRKLAVKRTVELAFERINTKKSGTPFGLTLNDAKAAYDEISRQTTINSMDELCLKGLSLANEGFYKQIKSVLGCNFDKVTYMDTYFFLQDIDNQSVSDNTNEMESGTVVGYLDLKRKQSKQVGRDEESELDPFGSIVSMDDFGSPIFIKEMYLELNELSFMNGVDGREDSFVRISSQTCPPCPFLIANRLYESVPTTQYEDDLIRMVNNILSVYNTNVEKNVGRSNPCPVHVNMIQMVVGTPHTSAYGSHNDTSPLLCCVNPNKLEPFEQMENGKRLPTASEMVVFTINFTFEASNKATHNIIWHIPEEDSVPSSVLGQISTTGNFAHFQGALVQRYCHHRVQTIVGGTNVPFRCVISFRMTGNNTAILSNRDAIVKRASIPIGRINNGKMKLLDPSSEYNIRNVLWKLVSGKQKEVTTRSLKNTNQMENDCTSTDDNKSDESDNDDATDMICGLSHHRVAKSKRYSYGPTDYRAAKRRSLPMSHSIVTKRAINLGWQQLDYHDWLQYGVCRGPHMLGCQSSSWEQLSREEATKNLVIHHCCLLTVAHQFYLPDRSSDISTMAKNVDSKASIRTEVLFRPFATEGGHRLFLPGEQYPLSYIANKAGIRHNRMSKPVVSTNSLQCNVIIITQAYKNDLASVLGSLHAIGTEWNVYRDSIKKSKVASKKTIDTRVLPDVVIFGSGGGPTDGEEQPRLLANTGKETPTSYEPTEQSHHNAINKCLQDVAMRNSPVALFSLDTTFGSCNDFAGGNEDAETQNLVTFHGYFHISSYEFKRSSANVTPVINEQQKSLFDKIVSKPDYIRNIRMKERKHFSFTLKQLFNFDEWTTISDSNDMGYWNLYDVVAHHGRGQQIVKRTIPFAIRVTPQQKKNGHVLPDDNLIVDKAGYVLTEIVKKDSKLWKAYMTRVSISEAYENRYTFDDDESDYYSEKMSREQGITIAGTRELSLIGLLAFNAGALRYLGKSLIMVDGSEFATPLPLESELPSVLRGQPMPMTNRCFDPIPLLLWTCSVVMANNREADVLNSDAGFSWFAGERVDLSGMGYNDYLELGSTWECKLTVGEYLETILLQATILRITGQPAMFEDYVNSITGGTNKMGVPNKDKLPSFLKYVTEETYIRQWISRQHKDSIPRILRKNIDVTNEFLTKLVSLIPDYCHEICESKQSGTIAGKMDRRTECTRKYATILEASLSFAKSRYGIGNTDDKKRLMFLSSQVISDVEEVMISPFGDCTPESVILGFGSLQIVKCYREPNNRAPIGENLLLQMVLDEMQMAAKKSQDWCTAMGWKLLDIGGANQSLVSIWNGRPINSVDAEHLLCKSYCTIVRTIGSRSVTMQPKASRPDCHPIRWVKGPLWSHKLVEAIMLNATKAFANIPKGERQPPDVCLMTDELNGVVKNAAVQDLSGATETFATIPVDQRLHPNVCLITDERSSSNEQETVNE